jgi:hypothetical protein
MRICLSTAQRLDLFLERRKVLGIDRKPDGDGELDAFCLR